MTAVYHDNTDFHIIPADGQKIQNLADSYSFRKIAVADLEPALPQESKKLNRYLHYEKTPLPDPVRLGRLSWKNTKTSHPSTKAKGLMTGESKSYTSYQAPVLKQINPNQISVES